jgi:hypothetical protein
LRLVDRITASGLHRVADGDDNSRRTTEELAYRWALKFGAENPAAEIVSAQRHFSGSATARVRATTAHDSYEQLVDVPCHPSDHGGGKSLEGLAVLPDVLQDPIVTGLKGSLIVDAAHRQLDVAEFSRFYLERRAQEVAAAGNDARKRKKLDDEFTPRIEATLVALQGEVHRTLRVNVRYRLDGTEYTSSLSIIPKEGRIAAAPEAAACEISGITVPVDCLAGCVVSGRRALKHRLIQSDVSGRYALPEHGLRCSVTGKQLLIDEAGTSDITGADVEKRILKTCAVTGKKAEPSYFGNCQFTKAEVLSYSAERGAAQMSPNAGKWFARGPRLP